MASFIFSSQSLKTSDPVSMPIDTAHAQMKDCVFYRFYPHGDNTFEVCWYKQISNSNESSFIRGEIFTIDNDKTVEDTCNAYLDQNDTLILPDHVEIIYRKRNYLTANFYKDHQLIANNIIFLGVNPLTVNGVAFLNYFLINKLLNVKNANHFFTQYYRPSILLSEVTKVTYNNGFYPIKVLEYQYKVLDEADLHSKKRSFVASNVVEQISTTPQGTLVFTMQCVSLLAFLFFVLKIKFTIVKIISPYYYYLFF